MFFYLLTYVSYYNHLKNIEGFVLILNIEPNKNEVEFLICISNDIDFKVLHKNARKLLRLILLKLSYQNFFIK
jgi:hypothetical protein